jgi:hypothetical protein
MARWVGTIKLNLLEQYNALTRNLQKDFQSARSMGFSKHRTHYGRRPLSITCGRFAHFCWPSFRMNRHNMSVLQRTPTTLLTICLVILQTRDSDIYERPFLRWVRRGRDSMVVGSSTTCAISDYYH